jgi:TPR repeat protein
MKPRAFLVLLSFCVAWPVAADQWEDGVAAYKAGDYSKAIQLLRPLAEQGHARAQNNLGVMYANGEGVVQDYVEALKWTRLAAEQGNARSRYGMGVAYATGQGVTQDYVFAYMWFHIASFTGFAEAVTNRDLVASRMTPADISRARELARECERKSYKGC